VIAESDLERIATAARMCAEDPRLLELGLLLAAVGRTGQLLAEDVPVDRYAATAVVTRAARVARSLLRTNPNPTPKDTP
jgi:hypothetical protein